MRVVVSQSMFFPWIGMLEQVRLADVFVYYDDVQFSKGSFVNRVQIKAPSGVTWLTVPLEGLHLGQKIDEISIAKRNWRLSHVSLLSDAYKKAPHCGEMLDLVERVYSGAFVTLAQLARASLWALVEYFGLDQRRRFIDVTSLGIAGSGTQRVLDVVRALGGTVYVTGHGGAKYLDHNAFDTAGIRIEYVAYEKRPYPQLHGPFTPFVSALDLVANCGRAGASFIASRTVYWKDFMNESNRAI